MSAGVNRVAQGVSRHSLEEVITGKRPLYEHGWMDTEEEEERAAAMCNGVVIELRPPPPLPQPPQRTQRRQIPRHSGLSLGLASPTPSSSHTLLLHLILWLRPKSSNLYHNTNSACFKIHVLSRVRIAVAGTNDG